MHHLHGITRSGIKGHSCDVSLSITWDRVRQVSGPGAGLIGDPRQLTVFVAREWDLDENFARNNDRGFLQVLGDDWVLEDQAAFVAVDIYLFRAR